MAQAVDGLSSTPSTTKKKKKALKTSDMREAPSHSHNPPKPLSRFLTLTYPACGKTQQLPHLFPLRPQTTRGRWRQYGVGSPPLREEQLTHYLFPHGIPL
jgi:hypothetical protein